MLPYAERHGLKLGYELYAPLDIESHLTQELIEQIERIKSPSLGIIPDAGIFARPIPIFARKNAVKGGAPSAVVKRALTLWDEKKAVSEAK